MLDIIEDGDDYNNASFVNWDFIREIGAKNDYQMWVQLKTLSPTYAGGGDNFYLENFMTKYISNF